MGSYGLSSRRRWAELAALGSLRVSCIAPVYLTNDQRIRLNLQGYGSDVPSDVVAAAETALFEDILLAQPKKPRSRTRVKEEG